VVVFQRFSGLGNDPSQAGHTLSSSFTLTVSLHLGHLTAWTFTRLISSGSKLVIGLLFLGFAGYTVEEESNGSR
jgi:hypothetical protein